MDLAQSKLRAMCTLTNWTRAMACNHFHTARCGISGDAPWRCPSTCPTAGSDASCLLLPPRSIFVYPAEPSKCPAGVEPGSHDADGLLIYGDGCLTPEVDVGTRVGVTFAREHRSIWAPASELAHRDCFLSCLQSFLLSARHTRCKKSSQAT